MTTTYPYVTGHCGGGARGGHERCAGSYGGAAGCACPCHTAPPPEPHCPTCSCHPPTPHP